MLFIFCYLFLYCNIDDLLNRFYLPMFKLDFFEKNNIMIQDNKEFIYSLTITPKSRIFG